jgi:hypothetical protein
MALGDIDSTKLNASGIISSYHFQAQTVGSFSVKKQASSDTWYVTINQGILLGLGLPSQGDALALLHGVMLQKGGGESQVNAAIQKMITDGRGTIEAAEVIHDTYDLPGGNWVWESARSWWAHIHHGTWTSTGTTTGTYLKVDPGSRVRGSFIQFSADDPINNGVSLPAGAKLRFTVTPSTGGVITLIEGTPPAAGDSRWTWVDSGGNNLVIVNADMESGGNFGWDPSDSVKIELFTE